MDTGNLWHNNLAALTTPSLSGAAPRTGRLNALPANVFADAGGLDRQIVGLLEKSPGVDNDKWNFLHNSTFASSKLSGNVFWLINSSTSRHKTGQRKYLFNIILIPPCYIALPNGSQTVAVLEGSVLLGQNFLFKNVLFVLGHTCNLICVPNFIFSTNLFLWDFLSMVV